MELSSEKDPARRSQLIDALRSNGVLNAAEATVLHKVNPDPAKLKELREQIGAEKKEFEELMRKAASAKKELERLNKELVEQGG